MILARSLYYLVSVLSLVASQTPSNCSAILTVNSSVPGHGAFMYHDFYVENTGSCALTRVFASIELPPYEEAFEYLNVSSETGELFGLAGPLIPGRRELAGTIILQSARLPIITLGSVECEASCMGSAISAVSSRIARKEPSPPVTAKIEVQWGANPRWIALRVLDDVDTTEVWIIDSQNERQLMKRENWISDSAFTLSPEVAPLELPLSLELVSSNGEVIILKDFIKSFSYSVLDTEAGFPNAPAVASDYTFKLVAHPSSNAHWVGLTPYGTMGNSVTGISIKASNTDYAPLNPISAGFFEVDSPNLALRLPISAIVTFADGSVLNLENVVAF